VSADKQDLERSRALLRELEGQRGVVERNLEVLKLQRAELEGQLEAFRVLEARLRGGMVQGFPRLGTEEVKP